MSDWSLEARNRAWNPFFYDLIFPEKKEYLKE
jgi:hypothetical protein